MRVFSVFFHPDPSISAIGGAEKRFIETLKILKREKQIGITVIESSPSLLAKSGVSCEIHEPSTPTAALSGGWLGIYVAWISWMLRTCIRCLRVARGKRYDLVLAPNNTVPNLIPACFVHLVFHLPICVVVHHIDILSPDTHQNFLMVYNTYKEIGFGRFTSFSKALAFFVIFAVLRRCDVCIAVSNFTARALVNNGVSKNRIYVNGNGVDTRYIKSFEFEGGKSYDGVFVGRISKEKGVFDMVNAWRRIVDIKNDARLLVIGSGPDIHAVRHIVKKFDLERNVFVKGRCPDKEMYPLVKASKVFVFPSLFEGWGLAIAEALSCGLPVVCYDIPALREVFGKCSSVFLVPTRNIKKLAATILEVLTMSETRELTDASKTYVKHFNWEEVAMRDLQIIAHAT